MIQTNKLVDELIAALGYAGQTLRLHPEQAPHIQKYLDSEALRFRNVVIEHQDALDILGRIVVY